MTFFKLKDLIDNAEYLGLHTLGDLEKFYKENRKENESVDLTLLRVVFAKAMGVNI